MALVFEFINAPCDHSFYNIKNILGSYAITAVMASIICRSRQIVPSQTAKVMHLIVYVLNSQCTGKHAVYLVVRSDVAKLDSN